MRVLAIGSRGDADLGFVGVHARSRCHNFIDSFLEQVAGTQGSQVGRRPAVSPVGTFTTTTTTARATAS